MTNPIYAMHWNMLDRCYNPNCKDYKHHGARGIKVCTLWRESFQAFYEWVLSQGYTPGCGLTLERQDNNAEYSPENCILCTRTQQVRNRRTWNKTGIAGVHERKAGGYTVTIGVNGKVKYIGSYPDITRAKAARQQAEQQYWRR